MSLPGGGDVLHIEGRGRELGSTAAASASLARVELRPSDFTLSLAGTTPVTAAYRDVTTLSVDSGRVLLVIGGEMRVLLEQLGSGLAGLIGAVRDRRARQLLGDRFVELPATEAIELVEYQADGEHGVAQLAFHAWGAALLPLDERLQLRLVRRGDLGEVEAERDRGRLSFGWTHGRNAEAAPKIQLLGLGQDTERQRARLAGLREAAISDAAGIVGRLLPDAPFSLRRTAPPLLVDGRPVSRPALGQGWPWLERAVLSEPVFAASYSALAGKSAAAGGASWISLAPRQPGNPEHQAWFFVALPGNLLALELVSEGAHATYLFRVVSRAAYSGEDPDRLAGPLEEAVSEISDALVDARFLRQPLYLPAERLAEPRYLRQRLAIAALPSLRRARSRFVARLIHRDEEGWLASLEEAIAWHRSARDDDERWSGGAAAAGMEDDDGEGD